MAHFFFAFNALMPLIILAFVGYLMVTTKLLNQSFIAQLNRFIFYVALPVLIFYTLKDITDLSDVNGYVIIFSVVMIAIIFVLALLIVRPLNLSIPHKAVATQAFFRGNFMLIGMPLALRLGGVEALAIVVILNVFIIPTSNLFSVVTFNLYNLKESSAHAFYDFVKSTLFNPLMVAVFLGIIAALLHDYYQAFAGALPFFDETLEMLAITATPLAMLAIGGQFKMHRSKQLFKPLFIGAFARLLFVPTVALSAAIIMTRWIDFTHAWGALIAIFASPVAVSSVAITKGFEGDDELASQIVLWTSLLASLTIFLIVSVFSYLGLL